MEEPKPPGRFDVGLFVILAGMCGMAYVTWLSWGVF
jgi:hypothetical protein